MNKKNVDYILSSTDGIELLANLFQNGMALDLVDVTRARDNIDLPEDERHIYDMADAALDRVDLDKLYENAGDFELQDKYPEFFDYLQSLQRDRENDEPERVREDEAGEAEEEIEEELEEGIPEPLSTRDTVVKNIIEGEHTGKESDSRKYVEKDEYRAKLDAEREESIRRALEADEALNKERELAAREDAAARLREQEFFDKRKAEETDFDEKARREKEAERYTEKDTDRSKSFEDRKDEAKIYKDYSTNADKQVDSSFRSDVVDNAGDAGKRGYQQSEQVNNIHGGANDAGDVSNAIHSKTYGTETAAETAATTAAMEMARREAAAKAQVGYGNTGNKETASKAETEKRNAEKYDSDKRETSKSQEESSRLDNNYSSKAESQIDGNSRTGSVNDAGDAGKRGYQQSEKIGSTHYGDSNAGDVTHVVKSREYETSKETADARREVDEAVRRDTAAREQKEAEGDRRSRREQEERRERQERAERRTDSYGSDTALRDEDTKREIERRQHEADKYRNAEAGKNETDTKSERESGNRVNNDYNSNRESQIDSSSRTGSVNDAGDAGTRSSMQSERVENLHNGNTNVGDVTNVVGGKTYASEAAAAATAAADEMSRRESAAKEQREADRENRNGSNSYNEEDRRSNIYNSDTAARDYDAGREMEKHQREAEANRYNDYRNAETDKNDQYNGSSKYEPERRTEDAMREETRREMDRRQQEADRYRNSETGRSETDAKRGENGTGNRVDNSYNSNRDRQVDSSSRTGSVHDAGNAGTRNSMQSEQVGNLHNGSTNAGDVTNVIGGRTHASDAAAATAATVTATAAAAEMTRREAAAKEQREADRENRNGSNSYNEEDRRSNIYNSDTAARDYDAGREMEKHQREAEANRYNDYRNAETDKNDQYNGSSKYEPERRTEDAMREETRREMDRRQQEADRYRNSETGRSETDAKRGENGTGNRVDNSYNSNRDRQVDSSSRTGSVHDAGNAGTRNSMQSEQVGNLHNGSTNAGDVTNVIGGRTHASDAAAATAATVTATAAAAEMTRREAAAKEQRGAEADQYRTSGKYEPERRTEDAMREEIRMEMDRRQREADIRRDDRITSPEKNQERPAEHSIDNNYNTQPGRQIDGTFKTGTISEAGKNASQPEKIDSVHGGSSTAKESLNAIKAKDYSGDNKSEATPVQSMVQGKKDIPNNQASGYRRDSYASAGMNAAVAGTATIVNDTHKASAAEKVVTEQKRPSESRPQEHRIDNNYNTQPGHQIDGTFKTGTVSEAGKNASQPEKIDSVHGGSSTAKESLNAIKAKDYSSGNKSTTTPVQPIFTNKDSVELKKNGESKIDNIAREPGSSASTQNIGLDSHSKKHVYERDSYEMAGQKTSENFGKPDLNQSALEKNIKDSKKQLAKEGSRIIDSENKEHIYTAKDGNKNNHVQINKAGAQVVDGHVSKEISGPADNVIKTPGSSKLDVSKAVAGQVAAAAAVGGVTNKNKSIAASANTSISQDTVKDVSEAVVKQKNKSQLWNQAINNTQDLTSKSNKLIADSYAMAGQIDAETAKMIAEFNNNPSFGFSPASGAGFSTNGTAEAIKNATKSSIGNSIAAAKIGADIYNASSRVKNVGLVGAIKNNEVGLKIDGRMKFFTIRSDGTINVDGVLLNVYKTERSNLVFVGWKDAFVNGNEIITSNNVRFQIGSDGNSIITGTKLNLSLSNKELNATDINKIGEKLVEPGIAASFAPAIVNKTISADDFVKDGDSFATNKLTERFGDRNLSNLLRRHQISGTIDRQGRIMHVMMTRYASNEMRKITFSKESIDFIAQNYNKIISVNADTASKIAKINSILEDRHLSDIEKECLFDLRTQLADKKMSCNVDKLKRQLKAGHLDEESARLAQDYINVFENTRKTIIKNGIFAYDDSAYLKFQLEVAGLPTNVKMLQTMMDKNAIPEDSMKLVQSYIDASNGKIKRGVIEDGFFAASMAMLVEANNLPSNRRALKKLLKTGNVTEEQKAIIKNMLKINRINGIRNFVARQAHKLQRAGVNAYRKSKNFLNKYMGSDYTFRGLMIMLGGAGKVRSIAMKAYRTIKFVRSVPMKFARAVDATRKAAISVAKVSTSAFRASQKALTYGARFTMSTGRLVKRKGVKFTVKRRGKRAIRKFKMLGNGIKNLSIKSLKTMVQIIIRLLTMLGTAILSAMAPILLILLFVLILIFSILSFISNEGDEVYYDAGDEDTTEAAQEMVDLLTLCHASFRNALSGGGGGGTAASGTDPDGGPQMQKGDSSKVGDPDNPKNSLYDVTHGTWWNTEGENSIDINWSAGSDCDTLKKKLEADGVLESRNGYAVAKYGDKTVFLAAFGTFWGKVGDVLKVEFNQPISLGGEPASKEIYMMMFDTKAHKDTNYPAEPEGVYGHHMPEGAHTRDFAEFMGKDGMPENMNGKHYLPVQATNLGSVLDGTCDLATIGGGLSTSVSADVFYRQEIDQDVYRDIIDQKNNIYYTFPEDQETPDGISPTPTPEGYDKTTAKGAVYGFYNNNQELISMVLAMYDFDINDVTSVKKTILAKADKSGINEEAADEAHELDVTNKIDDDTWKLIAYFDKYGLDMTNYTIGGYDDLRYSTLVALFNASHIITWTPVTQYHQGHDGLPTYDKNGKAIDETNTDGMTYQVPVMVYDTRLVSYKDGTTTRIPDVHQKTDANGDLVFETKYKACPGHKKTSTAVITLHFDSLLDIKGWYDKNIYGVDDFDKENPNYSSDKIKDINYKAKESVLKYGTQRIKKPEFKMGIPGTCSDSGETSSGSFSPGVMTESQKEVCRHVYKFLTKDMTPKLTKEQAVGVLVNIMHESDFNYTATEHSDGSGGYGLVQWTGGRRTNLVTWCNNNGVKYNTLEGQCKFLEYEFSSSAVWTNSGVNGFLQCSSAYDAGRYFLKYFERPAAKYEAQREASLNQDIATIESML